MAITRSGSKPKALPPQARPAKRIVPKKRKAPASKSVPKNRKLKDMAKTTPGVKPSSAFLLRFVRGRKPGTGMLAAMPAELVQIVAAFLPVEALRNLRLASKELESKTFWYFTREYFTQIKFTHSQYALHALLELSGSRLGQYVRDVGLGPPSNDQGKITFSKEPNLPDKRKSIIERMSTYAEDNRTMRLFSQDMLMIEQILRNMGGVTALTFINPCDKGAGNCQMHRSYGQDYASARLGEGFAHFDDVPLDTSQSMARLFSITLQAAQTTVADIHCIDYGMEHVSYYGFYDEEYPHESSAWDFPIDFPKWSLHNGLQNSSFSNLAVLKMHLGCSSYVYDKDSQDRFVYHFSKFLSGTSLLHTLSFTMVEEWDGKDLLTKLTASPVTATVRNFAMINFALTSTHLISVLDNLPTALRTLVLESTCGISRLGLGGIPWIRDTFTELRMIRVQSRCNCGCSYAGIFYDGNEMTEYLNEQIRELISESDEDLY